MPTETPETTAVELLDNRRISKVGTPQRHYIVSPGYTCARGRFDLIAVVPGVASTYVFAADGRGDISDFDALAIVGGTVDHETALKRLGLCVEAFGELVDRFIGGAA